MGDEELRLIRISTAGSVDDGKSTLIGRLLYDTKSIFEDQYEALEQTSKHRGESEVNLAHLTDGLRAEREQGITIDVAYRYFATPRRRFIIADTPGHQQYTRNMVTGASTADATMILIDARHGMTDQSKRHAFIASLLRIPQIIVVINKMDLVEYGETTFTSIKNSFLQYAEKLTLGSVDFIPVSALVGDNVVDLSRNMPWYKGPAVLESLEELQPRGRRSPTDLRLPIQYVIRPSQDFRGFAGRLASGFLRVGEEIAVLPSCQLAKIQHLYDLDTEVQEAEPGANVLLTLDRELDVSRGDMIVRPRNVPEVTHTFEAVLCWMSAEHAMAGRPYVLRHTTREVSATIDEIVYRIDIGSLHRDPMTGLELNDIGRVILSTGQPLFLDTYEHNPTTGGILLIDPVSNNVLAAGVVTRVNRGDNLASVAEKPAVLWLTGFSGAGKSTIADALLERLKLQGIGAVRLDGDDLRIGLNSDLGFSPEDRTENLRRAAHVAALLAGHGNLVICSFITPLESDRELVRQVLGDQYVEVFIKTSIEECRRRDPKGLYRRADAGELKQFTGLTAPYEAPRNADVVVDTESTSIQEAVELLLAFLLKKKAQQ